MIAVRPVLPPSDTPEALSTKVVVVDVPKIAPVVVARASAIRAPLILGSLPSLSNILAFVDTPIRVPNVSNKSTNKNAKITTTKSRILIPLKLTSVNTLPKVSLSGEKSNDINELGIVENIPRSAFGTYKPVSSAIIPNTQVARIPKRIAPLTLRTNKTTVIITPTRAKIAPIDSERKFTWNLRNVSIVSGLPTVIFALINPINAINKPIPPLTANLRLAGIALNIASRTFVNESAIKIRPSTNTANKATCHGIPIP